MCKVVIVNTGVFRYKMENLPTQLGLNREAAVVDTVVVFLVVTTRDGAMASSSGINKFEST
jgi:hypothetical protein